MNYLTFYESTANIFVDIMVWVVLSLAIFEIINLLTENKLYDLISRSKKSQVFWGAILGLIPGCGGPLLLVPLYKKRKVSLATLTAAFIATFGDAAFVILATDAIIFLHLMWIGFVAAMVTGYAMQFSGLSDRLEYWAFKDRPISTNKIAVNYNKAKKATHLTNKTTVHEGSWFYTVDKVVMPWALLIVSLVLLPMTIAGFLPKMADTAFVKAGEYISYVVTLVMISYYGLRQIAKRIFTYSFVLDGTGVHQDWATKTNIKSGDIIIEHNHTVTEILHTIFSQALLITFWVWVGLFASNVMFFYAESGIIAFFSYGKGWVGIMIGILVGMLPGCGPQIAFANFFFMTGSPLIGAALVANSINQDGDAAFALAAIQPRTAVLMRFLNVVPALIFGLMVWAIPMI